LWDTCKRQGKVIKEQERKVLDLEKLLAGQMDHITKVTRLIDQVGVSVVLD